MIDHGRGVTADQVDKKMDSNISRLLPEDCLCQVFSFLRPSDLKRVVQVQHYR